MKMMIQIFTADTKYMRDLYIGLSIFFYFFILSDAQTHRLNDC